MTVNLLLFNLKYPFMTWVLTHSALLQFHVWHLGWRPVPFLLNGRAFSVGERKKKLTRLRRTFWCCWVGPGFFCVWTRCGSFSGRVHTASPSSPPHPEYTQAQIHIHAHTGVDWYLLSCVSTSLQENADHASCMFELSKMEDSFNAKCE